MKAAICLLLVAYTAAAPAAEEAPAAERALECTEEGAYTLKDACPFTDDVEEYTKCVEPKSAAFLKACEEEDSEFANEFTTCVLPKFQATGSECFAENPTSFAAILECTNEKLPEIIDSCKTAEA